MAISSKAAGDPDAEFSRAETVRADQLKGRLAEVSDQVVAAIRERAPREQAMHRLERAWVEMCLRDLYGPWSHEGDRYAMWMRDDIRVARTLADRLGQTVGDARLFDRLLNAQPALRRVELW